MIDYGVSDSLDTSEPYVQIFMDEGSVLIPLTFYIYLKVHKCANNRRLMLEKLEAIVKELGTYDSVEIQQHLRKHELACFRIPAEFVVQLPPVCADPEDLIDESTL